MHQSPICMGWRFSSTFSSRLDKEICKQLCPDFFGGKLRCWRWMGQGGTSLKLALACIGAFGPSLFWGLFLNGHSNTRGVLRLCWGFHLSVEDLIAVLFCFVCTQVRWEWWSRMVAASCEKQGCGNWPINGHTGEYRITCTILDQNPKHVCTMKVHMFPIDPTTPHTKAVVDSRLQ